MLVSSVLGTGGQGGIRKPFLWQAIFYWLHQTHQERELIIVDGDEEAASFIPPGDPRIRYIHVPGEKSLPKKLNIGIAEAAGKVILKIDDDDFYAPGFQSEMVNLYRKSGYHDFLFFPTTALGYLADKAKLVFGGTSRFFGSGMGFTKALWNQKPFDENFFQGSDYRFYQDHEHWPQLRGLDPEMIMMVRHGRGHVCKTINGMKVEDYYDQCPVYHKPLYEIVGERYRMFYEGLKR